MKINMYEAKEKAQPAGVVKRAVHTFLIYLLLLLVIFFLFVFLSLS